MSDFHFFNLVSFCLLMFDESSETKHDMVLLRQTAYHIKFSCLLYDSHYRFSCSFCHVLSSSRTSVLVKLGLFNAKIRNENCRYIHRLIYLINEQDLLCHSIWNVSLILVTSLFDGGLKWVNFDVITVEKQVHLLCFGCVCRITFNVACNVNS